MSSRKKAALEHCQLEQYRQVRHARLALVSDAMDQLRLMLKDRDTPPSVRARLIDIAFTQADRMGEMMRACGERTIPSVDAPEGHYFVILTESDRQEFLEIRQMRQRLRGQSEDKPAAQALQQGPTMRAGERTIAANSRLALESGAQRSSDLRRASRNA